MEVTKPLPQSELKKLLFEATKMKKNALDAFAVVPAPKNTI